MKKIFFILFIIIGAINYAQQEEQSSYKPSNLQAIQTITVTIGGDFIVNGSFTSVKSERADQFITRIFTEAKAQMLTGAKEEKILNKINDEIDRFAKRDITLKKTSGEVIKIDLVKFRLTGDFSLNPYLRNDDVIIFPAVNRNTGFIEISGAVNKDTKFQFVDGDKLSDAILFAGGINLSYENVKYAEISRLNDAGNNEELIKTDPNGNFSLKRGDRIRIVAEDSQKKVFKTLVLGEVKSPGFVYLKQNGTLLKDVIQRAGGFTVSADLTRADLKRNYDAVEILKKYQLTEDYFSTPEKYLLPDTQIKMQQMQDALTLMRAENLQREDSLFFNIDNQLRIFKNGSLVDFTKLSDAESEESNFLVKDGDLIIVPQQFDYVYVFGQVAKTGYVKYSDGKNFRYYIEKSGGKSETARSDADIAVIKGKGKSWISEGKENLKIEPGDYIYVPKVVPKNFDYYLPRIGHIAGILGSIATIILLIIQSGK